MKCAQVCSLKRFTKTIIYAFVILAMPLFGQEAPRIFYSDLESGPNSGGENNRGAYVTIYGNAFGSTQGSSKITVGGGAVAAYPIWSNTKITFQLGSSAATGNIVVTTATGTSNALPFTVRAGNIYFVSTSGNASNTGSFTSPWATLLKARDSMKAGDITYAMNGVSQTTDDGQGWNTCMLLQTSGVAGAPIAMVAYPGATVTVGNINGPDSGIRSKGVSSYWVFAGLNIRGVSEAITTYGDNNWRVIGNDMTCPNGNTASACFETSIFTYLKMYGNNVHDTGTANATALYQGVYFSTDSNHIDFGWNTIANVHGCRGLQVHSSPLNGGGASDPTGHDQFDLLIHDNLIHDTQCDGIILATIDPSQGPVALYNNIIYNAGKGPNNPEGSGYWSCINAETWTNTGPTGSGTVEIYNNTLYNCGSFATPPYNNSNGAIGYSGPNGNINVHIRNNIMNVPSGVPYLLVNQPAGSLCATSANCQWVYGSNNLFFGSGTGPSNSYITNSLSADPLMVNAAGANFHLSTSSSPAAQGGTPTPQATDFDGVPLPQGASYPIGAYAYFTGSSGGSTGTVSISVSPVTVSLQAGQGQTFAASVSGSTNTAVNWSMSPSVGSLTSGGVYTAPASVTTQQTVVVTATSAADSTKSATATVTLTATTPAPAVGITVTPTTASVSGGQTVQFSATVSGSSNTAVTWSINPSTGTISTSGLYTAPATISTQQTVVVTAVAAADTTKSATASITLMAQQTTAASGTYTINFVMQNGAAVLSFAAPAGRPANDWIGLSSVNAPAWWNFGSTTTQGQTGGSVATAITTATSIPATYEARYYTGGGYTIMARSAPLALATQGFSVTPTSTSVTAGSTLGLSWTAGTGRTSSDFVGLYLVGNTSDSPAWWVPASGLASGSSKGWPVPTVKGTYELRYILGNTYDQVVKSAPITVH